jgi:hypothetical protein
MSVFKVDTAQDDYVYIDCDVAHIRISFDEDGLIVAFNQKGGDDASFDMDAKSWRPLEWMSNDKKLSVKAVLKDGVLSYEYTTWAFDYYEGTDYEDCQGPFVISNVQHYMVTTEHPRHPFSKPWVMFDVGNVDYETAEITMPKPEFDSLLKFVGR